MRSPWTRLVLRDDAEPEIPPQCFLQGETPLQTRLTLAPQLFGSNAAWLLLSFITVQTYTYYMMSAKDHPVFKTLVYSTVFVAFTQSAVEGYVSYRYLVSGWGDPLLLTNPNAAFRVLGDLQPLFDALPALFVQFFFAWRIWTFTMPTYQKSIKMAVAVICAFIVLTGICGFITVLVLVIVSLIGRHPPTGANVLVWTVSSAAADVAITVCMSIILYQAKAKSYYVQPRDFISRVMRLLVQTGLITAVFAIPVAPFYFRVRFGFWSLPCFLLGKCYIISLLANLNSRPGQTPVTIMKGGNEVVIANTHLTTLAFTPGRNQNPNQTRSQTTTNSGNGVLSFMRSIVRTMHDDINRPAPVPEEIETTTSSGGNQETHTRSHEEKPPGLGSVREESEQSQV